MDTSAKKKTRTNKKKKYMIHFYLTSKVFHGEVFLKREETDLKPVLWQALFFPKHKRNSYFSSTGQTAVIYMARKRLMGTELSRVSILYSLSSHTQFSTHWDLSGHLNPCWLTISLHYRGPQFTARNKGEWLREDAEKGGDKREEIRKRARGEIMNKGNKREGT